VTAELETRVRAAIEARAGLVDARHETAFRALHGFTEGVPALALDVFATTLVLHDHAGPEGDEAGVRRALEIARETWPWLKAALWKNHRAPSAEARAGVLVLGEKADLARRVREAEVRYAVALDGQKDAGFYLDTRNLRAWLKRTSGGARVLNTFAYTGSLGVAALAGGASQVVHLDRSREALNVAKESYTLNGFPIRRPDFIVDDVFAKAAKLRKANEIYDVVIIDPPFFSSTASGRVDLEQGTSRLLDKVRPLVADGGALVFVHNALFVPGAEVHAALGQMGTDGYSTIEELIDVPDDVIGYPGTRVGAPLVDPAPWNHPTKIAVVRVKRKDGRKA
jgi:23S rRNA (cytosine1962-C5)-methyltransferase